MSARAGYWDIEACAWVGAAPQHGVQPVPAEPSDTEDPAVPAPRADADSDAASPVG
jgi:hypothetical protein